MAQFERHFTLAEANELLPRIRELLGKIFAILDAPHAGPAKPAGRANGHGTNGHAAGKTDWSSLSRKEREALAGGLVREIEGQGIVIQDLRRGLIDFPALRGGEEVFLCYELADGESIAAWHELRAGFAGRRPIEDF